TCDTGTYGLDWFRAGRHLFNVDIWSTIERHANPPLIENECERRRPVSCFLRFGKSVRGPLRGLAEFDQAALLQYSKSENLHDDQSSRSNSCWEARPAHH